MQIYQDIWVNGVVQKKGIRDCESRYRPIAELCKNFNRPITILDIGANLGYYSFRCSSDFDCTSVLIEGSEAYQKALLDLINQQKCRERLILLGSRVNLAILNKLNKCEHFDVILALRVVHHFHEPFADVIEAIISMGDFVFIELPTIGENKVRARDRVQRELDDHSKLLASYQYTKVGEYPIHVGSTMSPLYLVENQKKKQITRPFYGSSREIQHSVESTFADKRLVKRDASDRGELVNEWVAGINLYTYHTLNGLFPERPRIAQKIQKCPLPSEGPLTDIRPWNMIFNGKVKLIDYTSLVGSRGWPFKENPQRCLLNTALYMQAGIVPLHGKYYKHPAYITKLWLILQKGCGFYRLIGKGLGKVYTSLRKTVGIILL